MGDWQRVGSISVDAGMIWIGDPCYTLTPDTPYAFGPTWDDFVAITVPKLESGNGVARFTKADGWGDVGLAVHSGMGDGVYPVDVRRDRVTGRVAELRIVFLPEDGG
jgi:hypothetical protein